MKSLKIYFKKLFEMNGVILTKIFQSGHSKKEWRTRRLNQLEKYHPLVITYLNYWYLIISGTTLVCRILNKCSMEQHRLNQRRRNSFNHLICLLFHYMDYQRRQVLARCKSFQQQVLKIKDYPYKGLRLGYLIRMKRVLGKYVSKVEMYLWDT